MLKKILRGLLLPLCLLCLWQIACSRQLFSPYLLPPPAQVAHEAVELLTSGVLLTHLAVSLRRVFLGFTLSCALALPLGIVCGQSRRFDEYCWLLCR